MDNEQLVTAIRSGDRKAFDQLCRLYYAQLVRYAGLFLDGAWSYDIVQEVLANVWLKRDRLDPSRPIYGYLLRSVFNQAVNYSKSHNYAQKYEASCKARIESMLHSYADPDNNPVIGRMYSEDMSHEIEACVSRLSDKCQEVFRMCYIDGMPQKEISEKLGISLSTVENHVYSALKQLRKMLPKDELLLIVLVVLGTNVG